MIPSFKKEFIIRCDLSYFLLIAETGQVFYFLGVANAVVGKNDPPLIEPLYMWFNIQFKHQMLYNGNEDE
jgi:hypothetical protein